MTNTIPSVPRELLERVLYLMDNYIGTTHTEEDELRALLSAPSPAGVDGCKGKNCGATDGASHSDECFAEHERAYSCAGVGGLEVVSNWVLFDAEADKPYIKKMLPEGFLAFFDCEEDARRAKANNHGTDYKRIDRVKAEDAKAIIDALRGELDGPHRLARHSKRLVEQLRAERDQQAQRIGELEQILRDLVPGCKWRFMRPRIDAALSAGNEPKQCT